MNDTAAVCSHCERSTQGRIYDGYKCAECHINFLESELNEKKETIRELEKHIELTFQEQEESLENKMSRIGELNEELRDCRKYRWAYELLVKELTKK